MIRQPPRSTQSRSSAASDVYKRQRRHQATGAEQDGDLTGADQIEGVEAIENDKQEHDLSLIHISEPTRPY